MSTNLEENKAIIRRYNHEGIAQGNVDTLEELLAPDFINHSAPAGMDAGRGGMFYFFLRILQSALSNLEVEILDQVAEGDKVTTRKAITGIHTGELLGLAPTQKPVVINVIDIYRLREGKLTAHWGLTTLSDVMAQLAS
ncbi:ester cyclase [Hymenobacter negativus]|uniref:Ester cyclase n=1 Tax=Hymenobacter negativus TaxID=2795026 RepID=A0ABS3QGU6_9BACT|nr:ester cyclase [Hymenobacter negativus]MBO2010341.1 ester cyclase [Hymenobacter negativus]